MTVRSMGALLLASLLAGCQASINSSNHNERLRALVNISDQALLARLAVEDADLCSVAVYKLTDQDALAKVALEGKTETVRSFAASKLTDQTLLHSVVSNSGQRFVRVDAAKKLKDQDFLAKLAMEDRDPLVRRAAVSVLTNQGVLAKLAMEDEDPAVRLAAVAVLTDRVALVHVTVYDREKGIHDLAVRRLFSVTGNEGSSMTLELETMEWNRAPKDIDGLSAFSERFPYSVYRIVALFLLEQKRDWLATQTANTPDAYLAFLEKHTDMAEAVDARKRLASFYKDDEAVKLDELRTLLANAQELREFQIQLHDFLCNLTVKSSSSILRYDGAEVGSVGPMGQALAFVPSSDTWQPIVPGTFLILRLNGFGNGVKGVYAHMKDKEVAVGTLISGKDMTLVIPREILPCDLEFRGLLYNYVPLRR
jgi:hypothetical protein